VTIGAQKAPHSYSVLELASKKGGLRLPMLNISERDALKLTSDSTEANGLFIYNTDINCVEFWSNGNGNTATVPISAAGYTSTSGNKWVWSNTNTRGWLITPSGGSVPTLFLPLAGYRGYLDGVLPPNTNGYYWSSSVNNTEVYALVFNSTTVYPGSSTYRAYGFSIRCVVDQ